MSLLPEDYNASEFEKESSEGGQSQFFSLKDGQARTIRIMGDQDKPETFVMGYSAWRDKKKRNAPNTDRGYSEMVEYAEIQTFTDRNGNEVERKEPKKFWLFQIYNVTEKRAQVWEVTRKDIRRVLEEYERNPKWGDLTQYDITVTRTGKDMDTIYSLMPEPPKQPPSDEVIKAIKEARIDCSAVFKDGGYPMGALTEDAPAVNDISNDQSNIDRLKSIVTGE
tara:strand:+ start:82 stop:750 length:669 start_codon:yes stop_codon:yes gene_type:complete